MNSIKAQVTLGKTSRRTQSQEFIATPVNCLNDLHQATSVNYSNAPRYIYSKPARWIPEHKTQLIAPPSIRKILSELQKDITQKETDNFKKARSGALERELAEKERTLGVKLYQPTQTIQEEPELNLYTYYYNMSRVKSSTNIKNKTTGYLKDIFNPQHKNLNKQNKKIERDPELDQQLSQIKRFKYTKFFEKRKSSQNVKQQEIKHIKSSQQEHFPENKIDQNFMMFKEIFIKPRMNDFQQVLETNRLKNKETHKKRVNLQENIQLIDETSLTQTQFDIKNHETQSFRLDEVQEHSLIRVVMSRFNQDSKGDSFFMKQIELQPPEGLMTQPGQGADSNLAPSIPISKLIDASIHDLQLIAKGAVGDMSKDTHIQLSLAMANEQKGIYKQAIKYYKRFFYFARVLEDPIGSSLALNRLGVIFHKQRKNGQSLQLHKTHLKNANQDNIFASYYNIGISFRLLNNYEESIHYFTQAYTWTLQNNQINSQSICLGQLGITYMLTLQIQLAQYNFEKCYELCCELKNKQLQLDCILCLGYISSESKDFMKCKEYFQIAYNVNLSDKSYQNNQETIC